MTNELGEKANRISVELLGPEGEVVTSATTREGRAEICDFPFGPHELIVDRGGCGEVSLPNIRISYTESIRRRVVVHGCGRVMATACLLDLKAVDSTGVGVPDAVVSWAKGEVAGRTDEYGRLHLAVRRGTTRVVVIDWQNVYGELVVTCTRIRSIQAVVPLKKKD